MKNGINPQQNGIDYFFKGWKLVWSKEVRFLLILPFIASFIFVIIFILGLYPFLNELKSVAESYGIHLPNWLQSVYSGFIYLILAVLLFIFAFFFNTILMIISAPLNGLLSEKIEAKLRNQPPLDTSFSDILKDLPRIFKREFTKIGYTLLMMLFCVILTFLPIIGLASPILWFLLSAWLTNLQYADYPFDNHKIAFKTMRQTLHFHRADSILFGTCVNVCTMVPILNFFVMPAAVCGATAMWVDIYADRVLETPAPINSAEKPETQTKIVS